MALLCASPIQAQQFCAAQSTLAERLGALYGERLRAQGIFDLNEQLGERFMEIYVSDDDKSWTVISVNPETQLACVVATGKHWSAFLRGRGA